MRVNRNESLARCFPGQSAEFISQFAEYARLMISYRPGSEYGPVIPKPAAAYVVI
jgi:hypothetical protein